MSTIDLNCDMGEGIGNDSLIMPYISSCSIACGGHFGNRNSILETLILAKKHKVKVGAHPAYPDPENFGRKSMSLSIHELKTTFETTIKTIYGMLCPNKKQHSSHKNHMGLYTTICFSIKFLHKFLLNSLKSLFPMLIFIVPQAVY